MSIFNKKPKILIVEDEPDIAEGMKARLSLDGFDVILAPDGKRGVEEARDKKPNMIILDVMMPVLNGYEACKILKGDKRTQKIPVLILTALPNVKDAEAAFSAGADDFLNTPYTNDRLMKKVFRFLPKK